MRKLLLACALLIGGTVALPTTTNAATFCLITVENPHYSTTWGGIIAKGRFTCPAGPGFAYTDLHLLVCTVPIKQDIYEMMFRCRLVANAYSTIYPNGNRQTRYVPNQGEPGMHGCGFWMAWGRYTWGSFSQTRYNFANEWICR